MQLTDDIRRAIATLTISPKNGDFHARIGDGPGTKPLDRKLYLMVNEVLETLGGKWSRGAKAHVFAADPTDAIEYAIDAGVLLTRREADKEIGYFRTPDALAANLVERAGGAALKGKHVLEPSAGDGSIVRALLKVGALVAAVEIDHGRCEALQAAAVPGFPLNDIGLIASGDFLSYTHFTLPDTGFGSFDAVVMNPPFAKGADIAHVTHALNFLRRGGTLVSVMGAGVEFRQDKNTTAFRDRVSRLGGTFERLPEGSFKESGTGVHTVVLTVRSKA